MKLRNIIISSIIVSTTIFAQTGEELFDINCASCHVTVYGVNFDCEGSNTKISDAPYITDLVKELKSKAKTKEHFVNFVSDYIKKPSKQKSRMKRAIKKYGLMPSLSCTMSDEQISKIATYLYTLNEEKSDKPSKRVVKKLDKKEALFNKHCSSCHTVSYGINVNLEGKYEGIYQAPYMGDVVKKIKQEMQTKEEFSSFIKSYIHEPNKRKSIYGKRVIKKYGLMPPLKCSVTEDESSAISAYLYEKY